MLDETFECSSTTFFLDEEGYLLKLYQSLDEQKVEACFRENRKDLTLPFTHFVDSLGIFLRWKGRHYGVH